MKKPAAVAEAAVVFGGMRGLSQATGIPEPTLYSARTSASQGLRLAMELIVEMDRQFGRQATADLVLVGRHRRRVENP